MSENMDLCRVPPGFRFHPTEEELLKYYLCNKVAARKINFDVIRDVDLNKLEPWDIQEVCKIGPATQNHWYFFSHKDKKYPTGTRTNRATAAGFWKATGRDKAIHDDGRRRKIGMRKTLVFYRGRAPHGQKMDWIMHEYRLDDDDDPDPPNNNHVSLYSGGVEEGWVVCRLFRKRNLRKSASSLSEYPLNSSTDTILKLPETKSNDKDKELAAPAPDCGQLSSACASRHEGHGFGSPVIPDGSTQEINVLSGDWGALDEFCNEDLSFSFRGAGGPDHQIVHGLDADFWNFSWPPLLSLSEPLL